MDEVTGEFQPDFWDAGFEGGRCLIYSHLGIFSRVFERPKYYKKRLWHSVHELPIREWRIQLNPLQFGVLCEIQTELIIRYQPSIHYAKQHLEQLSNLGSQIEESLGPLIRDLVEEEIRKMETDSSWLEDGCGKLESTAANLVNEILVLRGIHCRSRCHIKPQFAAVDSIDLNDLPVWQCQQKIYEEFLKRRRESKERFLQEQTKDITRERTLIIEREQVLLELAKTEEIQQQAKQAQQMSALQLELQHQESFAKAHTESEIRILEEESQLETRKTQTKAQQTQLEVEANLEAQRIALELENQRLVEQRENEIRQVEVQILHEIQLQEKQKQSVQQAQNSEIEKQRLELESREKMLAEALASKTRLQDEKLRHENLAKSKQALAEREAIEQELLNLKATHELLTQQLGEKQKHNLKAKEDELLHENWIKQMAVEAEITSKANAAETKRRSEEALQSAALESERQLKKALLENDKQIQEMEVAHNLGIQEIQVTAEISKKQIELEKLRVQIEKMEVQLTSQLESEARLQEEQIRHQEKLRELNFAQVLKAREKRGPALAELESYIDGEIGLLALERQRMKLEEEIRQTKLAHTQSFLDKVTDLNPSENELNPSP